MKHKDRGPGTMKDEEITLFNTGIADIGAAWMIALAMLVILFAWSFA